MKDSSAVLPSFTAFPFPQSLLYDNKPFPLCLTPPPHRPELQINPLAVTDYISQHRDEIEFLLQQHSALLFRGFASNNATPTDFAAFVEDGLQLENFPYVGGNAVRTSIVRDRVFTANESPPSKPIPFHHELAQTPDFPSRLLFFCDLPAQQGGETPILLSTAVCDDLKQIHPSFIKKLESHGVVYSRIMTAHDRPESAIGRGWRATFQAQTKQQVEDALTKKGYHWEWIGDGENPMLREISPVLPAILTRDDGKKVFFNQIFAVWGGWRDEFNTPEKCLKMGDGSEMDPQAMQQLSEIINKHKVAIPWRKGDILYIDNMTVQHSRNTFVGKRRVLASLAK